MQGGVRTKERGVKSSGSRSQCFGGGRILKMKGGAVKEENVDGEAEIAEKLGTLDKMKNGMENG